MAGLHSGDSLYLPAIWIPEFQGQTANFAGKVGQTFGSRVHHTAVVVLLIVSSIILE